MYNHIGGYMYRVLFVCYGNICRSPMAEMIFKDLIYKNNKRYKLSCASRATSFEEIGNDIYPDAKKVLKKYNITIESHSAKRITKEDYNKYDFIIVMEDRNIKDILNIIGEDIDKKIHKILEYTDNDGNIEDPWYTGRFDYVYNLIYKGCIGLFKYIDNLGDKDEI